MTNTFDIARINEDTLEQFRQITDPLADQVVSQIIESGFEKQINQVFMALVRNNSYNADTFSHLEPALASILDDYFHKSAILPSWADQGLIEQGEEVFSLYGPEIFMLLNVSSLPMCYTCAKGAQVLFETGRLLTHNGNVDPLARRLMETAQMVVNVLSPGGLAPDGAGIVTIQKVRLIHASIRYFLKQGQYKHTPWNVGEFGEPINQEDLAGTLMSFAPVILSGLKHLEVELSENQKKAYMHCWKVVGHLMGINEELLPDTYDDAFELAAKILKHQAARSEAGEELTKSCITFINSMIPGNIFNHVPEHFMDFFLKDFSERSGVDLSKCIGIKKETDFEDKLFVRLSQFVTGELVKMERHQLIKEVSKKFNKLMLNGIIHHFNDGKQVAFNIPPSLRKNWQLEQ